MFSTIERHKDRVIARPHPAAGPLAPRRGRPQRVAADAGAPDPRRPGRTRVLRRPDPAVPAAARQPAEPDHHVRPVHRRSSRSRSRPAFFNPVFRTFNFQPPNSQSDAEARTRLIFVLVVAVVILFALYLRLQSSADTNERASGCSSRPSDRSGSTGTARRRSPTARAW